MITKMKTENLIERTPIVKWAGKKTFLVPKIIPMWEAYERQVGEQSRLVEPFAGSLAMAIGLEPANALLNDFNFHVFNLYRWVKAGLRAPIHRLTLKWCSTNTASFSTSLHDHPMSEPSARHIFSTI